MRWEINIYMEYGVVCQLLLSLLRFKGSARRITKLAIILSIKAYDLFGTRTSCVWIYKGTQIKRYVCKCDKE